MTESNQTCKPFPFDADALRRALPQRAAQLLARAELLGGLEPMDLREMAKRPELPNLDGLAAHRILRPAPGPTLGRGMQTLPSLELNEDFCQFFERAAGVRPWIVVEGCLGGQDRRAFPVRAVVSARQAQLAAALQSMLWPADGLELIEPFTLLVYGGPVERKDGQVVVDQGLAFEPASQSGLALVVGCDDPSVLAEVLLAQAAGLWHANGFEVVGGADQWCELDTEGSAGGAVAILGQGEPTSAQRVASLDPMLLTAMDDICPVWANPLLPEAALATAPQWHRAAREVGALPFGMQIDDEGRFAALGGQPAESEGHGWMVVPRRAIPAPFFNLCTPARLR